jgi:hypothetical protein
LAHASEPSLHHSHLRGESTWLSRTGTAARGSKGKSSDSMGRRLLIYLNCRIEMPRNIYVVLLILVMIAVVVGVDLLFFRRYPLERLIVNIGIVLVFAAFYLRFLSNP